MSLPLRILAALTVAVLLVLLLGPSLEVEQQISGLDKVAHFGAFGLLLWAFGVLFPSRSRVLLAICALLAGGGIELVQGMIGRDASWFDFLADALGVALALLVWATWRGFRPRQARQRISATANA